MFLEADVERKKIIFLGGWGPLFFTILLHGSISFFCLFYFDLNIWKNICKAPILGSAIQLMLNKRQILLNY